MNPPPRRGRPPKGTSNLSRPAIVDAALDVIAADGLDGVSMRTVARGLGVDPKSLYNHIDGKDALLDAVAERVLGSITLDAPTGDLGTDLHALATAFREVALAHPTAASLVLTRQLASVEGLAPVDAAIGILRAAGCPPAESVHLLRAVLATLIGTLLRETHAGPTYGSSDPDEVDRRRAALENSGLPAVVDVAPHLARYDSNTEFDYAVALAVAAVETRIASLADRSARPVRIVP
ncbi:MAG: TetR family transcriptional regulator [Rhodococcus sp. (in: high G+C Gram-positive bacteria)]|uniref:TetR/AcrR family transcriptional regulator n=1 Tax=Rhodococcus sp. TaxID=1831 RepID=UPI003BB794D4